MSSHFFFFFGKKKCFYFAWIIKVFVNKSKILTQLLNGSSSEGLLQ